MNSILYKLGKMQLNMGRQTKYVDNIHRRVSKGSDMLILVKFFKDPQWLEVSIFFCNTDKYQNKIFIFFFFYICVWLYNKTFTCLIDIETYSELSQTSKMELFANITNTLKPFSTIFEKSFILHICLGSDHMSQTCTSRVFFNKIGT